MLLRTAELPSALFRPCPLVPTPSFRTEATLSLRKGMSLAGCFNALARTTSETYAGAHGQTLVSSVAETNILRTSLFTQATNRSAAPCELGGQPCACEDDTQLLHHAGTKHSATTCRDPSAHETCDHQQAPHVQRSLRSRREESPWRQGPNHDPGHTRRGPIEATRIAKASCPAAARLKQLRIALPCMLGFLQLCVGLTDKSMGNRWDPLHM